MKIVISMKIPRSCLKEIIDRGYKVHVFGGRYPPYEWLCNELCDADVLVVAPYHVVNNSILRCGNNLKLIVLYGAGYENIDLSACDKHGVCVVRCADAIDEAAAEHALALTLALLRKVVIGDKYIRSGLWSEGPAPRKLLSTSLKGKVVGIVGLGKLGTYIAKLFKALNARVIYWSRNRKYSIESELGIEYSNLEELFEKADIVIVSLSYSKETHHFINEKLLKRMKHSSAIINVSRGAVIDTNALVKALREGWIAGAGLDVFEPEPLPKDHELTKLENVVLTPHIAGYTYEAMIETCKQIVKVIDVFAKEKKIIGEKLNPTTCSRIMR